MEDAASSFWSTAAETSFAPLVNSLNLGIGSPLLLGPPPLQLAQIKTQLALQQLTSLATSSSAPPHAWFNQALLKSTMFSPRGTLPPRPRGPNPSGTKPPGSFRGGGAGGLQRKPAAGTPQGAPQRFSGQESFQWTGSQRINVRVTLHRADPRQVKEKTNLHQEQKSEPHTSCWDSNPRPAVTTGQKSSASARIPEQNSNAQNRYTPESASSILASFGLSNEDLEELSRYPDEQLTPENMPLILREIRIRKMGHSSSRVHPQSRGEEPVGGPSGAAVKSKVIDYGHASKYGYTEDPLEVRPYNPEALPAEPLEPHVYNPEAPSGENREDFQREQNMPMSVSSSSVTCNPVFPVEELIKPTGFQSDSSNPPSFFPAETPGKVSGLCAAPSGLTVVTSVSQPAIPLVMPPMVPPVSQPAVPPVMPPMVPPVSQPAVPPVMPPMMPPVSQPAIPPVMPPVLPPVSQPAVPPVMPPMMPPMITPLAPMLAPVMLTFVQQSMTQHVMPPISHPPFSPELLAKLSQHERSQRESGTSQSVAPSAPGAGQKPFQPKAEGPIKSPFGIVKASWLPAFLQADSQKIQRLPTPSMMNDYYATSPRIFPHMCSLCNIECTHMKPAVPPVMPPMMPPMITPLAPMLAPVMLTFVQQSMTQHVMPPISHPPFSPELLAKLSQHERSQRESGTSQSVAPSAPGAGQKPFQPKAEGPIKSPFGIVKASWLPAFLQADSQKIQRLPTPSMMNDYYATSPRIFPHMCSLCNIECTHMKDWILHQNTPSHIESCCQLRQQYPDWNPESHSSKRNAGERKENQTPKRRSSSASPRKKSGNVKKPPKTSGSLKASKKEVPSGSGSSSSPGTDDLPQSKETEESKGGSPTEPSAPRPVPYNRLLRKELLSCGTVLQITGLPDDGFSDQDIKKIVQPFGKVSDFLVLRSKNMAFLEMNYKEAVVAAVKYGKTAPVLINGKQVKISVAEKPKVSSGQELDDTCVVVISNLPEKGYSVEEVSNLAKPFGGLRDVLILSSHKKAYMEISRKSADSMVKFYTCFPMSLDGNQLSISMGPQWSTVRDEEAIFTAIIKDSDPKVNTETLHNQFVHLGNLPADGYRELEVVCVGLRFGKVHHYVVLKNKNKAILQLDSPKSARSMYSFLKQYPYSMGEHTLTCTLSPQGEATEADPVVEEVKPEEPSPGSSGLKKYPEGSGVVQTAAANPPVEPSVAQEGPVAICHVKDQMSAVQLEPSESQLDRALRESPAQTSVKDLDAGVEATVVSIKSTSTQPAEGKPEEMQPPPASVEEEEAVKDSAHPELLESAAVSSSEKEIKEKGEELPAPPVEPAQELSDGGKAEDVPSDGAAGGHLGAVPEPAPPGGDAASVKMVSPIVTPTNHKSDAPENNPVSDPVKTKDEMPVTQITKKKPMLKTGAAEEKKLDVAGADKEVKPEESALKAGRAAEDNPDKLLVKTGAETEKKSEKLVASVGIVVENTADAVSENSQGSLINTQQNKGTGPAKTDETHRTVTFNSSLSAKDPSSVGITLLKAVVSLPDILKSRVPMRRKKPLLCKGGGKKAPLKPKPQGQAVVEKKMAHKEEDHPQPGSSQASPGDGSSKCKVSRSSVGGGKGGNGRNSSQQEKDSRVESRASSKQSQEGESRSSSMKTDNSSNKAPVGGNAKASRSGSSSSAKQKEEEELFPFNLDEFVTVDEVVEEVESPVKTRRNPPRVKRKVGAKTTSSSEPGSKRRKGKSSEAHLPEGELSFVTLDEIGEEEEVAAHDPQGLVVVDEVMEEEELLSEAVKDPQSLVTLDEISEQEDLGSRKGVPGSAFEEQDLKAEPLVTVDEIGEVEELPLNEPTDLSLEEVLKQKKGKGAAEKAGGGASSQVSNDPSALLTVDEIQEDSEDNPLVTLDEVNEDEDDFLADFNRLKEELNFVTVDEVGEEDEEEENTLPGTNVKEDNEDSVAVAGPEEEEKAAIAGPEGEEVAAVAGSEEMQVLGDTSPKEETTATPKSKVDQLGSGDKDPVSKQKKKAPSEASKTQSTPRDLDYLLPKAGFFCQICSLFYADETSVKNHCKTPLHQQNMEKFMAKQQQQEDNDGEEQSSR
ncbi:PREDICTED: zinc finger protein 638 [Chaetura pelagica]|uniref:zinc finger protein 638 n=1 Tax=Chaetura pelagica TaxID=8897 RepID=UPI00052376DE|nr:PREDICTED: zinc finger protein 638 [Chaetura pelagica]